jgi:hypothetical protein
VPPDPLPRSLTGTGALAVNLSCALMLARYRMPSRKPYARGFPVGAERGSRQCRHHRGGAGDGVSLAVCVAGFDCRAGIGALNADAAGSLDGGPGGTPGGRSLGHSRRCAATSIRRDGGTHHVDQPGVGDAVKQEMRLNRQLAVSGPDVVDGAARLAAVRKGRAGVPDG